jgi:NADH-ubiquinone oxidoreductase chain 1
MINNILNLDWSFVYSIINVLFLIVPILLAVAWITVFERKLLAILQRRTGPNVVGIYGVLQPFSDALKLILKETVIPGQSNKALFYLAPVSTLIFSLLGWAIIPVGEGLAIFDFSLGILYTLALSSLGVYGILFSGWSANSNLGS